VERATGADGLTGLPSDSLADYDSILRVSFIVPHDLATPADDKVTRWFTQIFYKSGRPVVSTSDVFTPDAPVSPGQIATAGASIHEDILKPINGQSVIRTLRYRITDPAKGQDDWRDVRYFENGDSSVATGSSQSEGVGTYVKNLGLKVKSSGWADANTGAFRDTLTVLDAAWKTSIQEFCEGTLKGDDGLGEFDRTTVRQGVATKSHFKVTQSGTAGMRMERRTGSDTSLIVFAEDTATTSARVGGVKRTCSWFPDGEGVYKVLESGTNAKDGTAKDTGEFTFGEDGSGTGAYTAYAKGKAQPEAKVFLRADGAAFLDGVKIGN